MRILLLNQFFWPDTAATAQLLGDLAEHLAGLGETVEVICGSARYGVSNSGSGPRREIAVTRVATPTFSTGVLGRLNSYLSFLVGSLWYGLRHPAPDVVVTLTTPPLISLIGMAIQKFRGSRHIIWEMDMYPDIAVDLGVLKPHAFSTKVFAWLADLPRRHADRVIALGECMRARLQSHGIPANRIFVVENWADGDAFPGVESSQMPCDSEALSIIYSGNLGRAHDVETIAGAMAEMNRAGDGLQFIFGGGGSRQGWLRDYCAENGLSRVEFLPYCERGELKSRLAGSHIGLVTQHVDTAGSVVPSKTAGLLAAGRPILFIGPRHSNTADIIRRFDCGWQIDCNDVTGLVELLRHLNLHKELVYAAGARAFQAFVDHYQRSTGVARITAALHTGVERKLVSMAGGAKRPAAPVAAYSRNARTAENRRPGIGG